ncbi:hypothetical protein QVD17_30096 [Tagetes erecta]|uniref:Uncharacterized protein n=1 Tax=Tagetes erecta TaxID=13708 RepID=A0AAD8K1A2_TARER|nr:hypothetical protein QVD17_30096 [Tagetes erecta]
MVGLLSATLGFIAELIRLQLGDVKDESGIGCVYPNLSGVTALGVIAIVALLGFRVSFLGTRSPYSEVQISRYLSLVTWCVAMIFYIIGLIMTTTQGNSVEYQRFDYERYSCNVVKPGIYGTGASFALTSVILEIVYFATTHQYRTDNPVSYPSTQPLGA